MENLQTIIADYDKYKKITPFVYKGKIHGFILNIL